jgi:superfamily II DNA or RNA helicase
MYLDMQNSFTLVREGDLPVHLLRLFNFQLRNDLYLQRNYPNLPMQNKSIYFPQWKCFLTGAIPFLLKEYPCHVVDNRTRPPLDKPSIQIPDHLRPNQKIGFERMLQYERGIINHTTSTGKTYLASAWVSSVPVNHLVIVHRKEIFYQFKERFEQDLDEEFDIIWKPQYSYAKRRVALGMIQSIEPRVKSKEFDIGHYQSIICDEGHHAGIGTQYMQVLLPSDAFFRFSFTATPKREAGDTIVQVGLFGPILHEYRYKEAVADGYVTPVNVFIVKLPRCRVKSLPVEPYAPFYREMIVDNVVRNDVLADIAVACINTGKSTLGIAQQIDHAINLSDLIKQKLVMSGWSNTDAARQVDYVHGQDPDRLQKKDLFENRTIKCLIGTSLYDEGIDIHAISAVILAGGGRSERAVLQRVGRGQRLDIGKHTLIVFDLWDDFHHKPLQHSKRRLEIFKKEGYQIQAVKREGA